MPPYLHGCIWLLDNVLGKPAGWAVAGEGCEGCWKGCPSKFANQGCSPHRSCVFLQQYECNKLKEIRPRKSKFTSIRAWCGHACRGRPRMPGSVPGGCILWVSRCRGEWQQPSCELERVRPCKRQQSPRHSDSVWRAECGAAWSAHRCLVSKVTSNRIAADTNFFRDVYC